MNPGQRNRGDLPSRYSKMPVTPRVTWFLVPHPVKRKGERLCGRSRDKSLCYLPQNSHKTSVGLNRYSPRMTADSICDVAFTWSFGRRLRNRPSGTRANRAAADLRERLNEERGSKCLSGQPKLMGFEIEWLKELFGDFGVATDRHTADSAAADPCACPSVRRSKVVKLCTVRA